MRRPPRPDFLVGGGPNVYMIRPRTPRAYRWAAKQDVMQFGGALILTQTAYAAALRRIATAGMIVKGDVRP